MGAQEAERELNKSSIIGGSEVSSTWADFKALALGKKNGPVHFFSPGLAEG